MSLELLNWITDSQFTTIFSWTSVQRMLSLLLRLSNFFKQTSESFGLCSCSSLLDLAYLIFIVLCLTPHSSSHICIENCKPSPLALVLMKDHWPETLIFFSLFPQLLIYWLGFSSRSVFLSDYSIYSFISLSL